MKEARQLHAAFSRQLYLLQCAHGISEREIRAIERAREAELLPKGNELWRAQVEEVRATDDLDGMAQSALERLTRQVNPQWLRAEAENPTALGVNF